MLGRFGVDRMQDDLENQERPSFDHLCIKTLSARDYRIFIQRCLMHVGLRRVLCKYHLNFETNSKYWSTIPVLFDHELNQVKKC